MNGYISLTNDFGDHYGNSNIIGIYRFPDPYRPPPIEDVIAEHRAFVRRNERLQAELLAEFRQIEELLLDLASWDAVVRFLNFLRGFPGVRWLPQIKEVIYAHALLRVGWRRIAPN